MSTISDSSGASYAEQARADAAEAERARAQEDHQDQMRSLKEEFEQDKRASNEEYNRKLLQVRKEAQEEVRRLKDDLYNQEGKKYSQDSRDVSEERNRLQNYRQELDRNYEERVSKAEHSKQEQLETAEIHKNDQINTAMRDLNRSHRLETKHLNDTLKQATVDPRDVEKELAETHAKAIHDIEGPARRNQEYIVSAYETSMGKMRDQAEKDREANLERMTQAQYQTMGKANKMMRDQKNEFIKQDQARVEEFKQIQADLKREVGNEKVQAERGAQVLQTNHEIQTKAALDHQADAFNHGFGDQKAAYEYKIQDQQNELTKLKTTDQELLASPALVERIHRTEEGRHLKDLEAQRSHHQNQEAGMMDRDVRERREIIDSYQREVAQAHRQGMKKLDQEKSLMLSGYEDLRSSKEKEVSDLRGQHSSRVERDQLKHAQELSLLQRRNLASMDELHESATGETKRKVDEVAFTAKVQNRELVSKLGDERRDHENKLAEARNQHDMEVNELRLDFDTRLRDQQRKSQQTLEERSRAAEHQLKEQELAFKDKERFLTEHYEEEIDKMKQTNARLIQKKS